MILETRPRLDDEINQGVELVADDVIGLGNRMGPAQAYQQLGARDRDQRLSLGQFLDGKLAK